LSNLAKITGVTALSFVAGGLIDYFFDSKINEITFSREKRTSIFLYVCSPLFQRWIFLKHAG